MHYRLPRSHVETLHRDLIGGIRRDIFTSKNAINQVRVSQLYVHVRLPGSLPQLELTPQTDMMQQVMHYQTLGALR